MPSTHQQYFHVLQPREGVTPAPAPAPVAEAARTGLGAGAISLIVGGVVGVGALVAAGAWMVWPSVAVVLEQLSASGVLD